MDVDESTAKPSSKRAAKKETTPSKVKTEADENLDEENMSEEDGN